MTNSSSACRAIPSGTAPMNMANIAIGGIMYSGRAMAGDSWNHMVCDLGTNTSVTAWSWPRTGKSAASSLRSGDARLSPSRLDQSEDLTSDVALDDDARGKCRIPAGTLGIARLGGHPVRSRSSPQHKTYCLMNRCTRLLRDRGRHVDVTLGIDGHLMRREQLTGAPPRALTNVTDDLPRGPVNDLDDVVAQIHVVHVGLLRIFRERQVGRPLRCLETAFRINGNGALEHAFPVELENPFVRTVAGIDVAVLRQRHAVWMTSGRSRAGVTCRAKLSRALARLTPLAEELPVPVEHHHPVVAVPIGDVDAAAFVRHRIWTRIDPQVGSAD